MAGVLLQGQQTRSGRKNLDAELNLVPFIDLLSVCICFLLMTAVWMQVASLEVKQSTGTEGSASTQQGYELKLKFQNSQKVQLNLSKQSRSLRSVWVQADSKEAFETKLDQTVKELVQKAGGKAAHISSVFISPHPSVSYGSMIDVMDVLRGQKLNNIGVLPQ